MEPESPTAFGGSRTKGSFSTQALDPVAVTQHVEGHFISSSAFFSQKWPRATFKKQEVKVEKVKEEVNHRSASSLWSITSPTEEPGEVWGLCQLSPGTAHCSDGCF